MIALLASPVVVCPEAEAADTLATARLVSCGDDDCLLVRGDRPSAAHVIRINDHLVKASGDRKWSTKVPVSTLRSWSAPYARTIDVAVIDTAGSMERNDAVRLPVGLLGQNVELASLVVRAR